MRYMGIDYGKKRVGIALSDEGGRMAFPKEVLKNDDGLLRSLEEIVEKENVGHIVIGLSLNMDGSRNQVQESIDELIGDLTLRVGIPIDLEPEHLSTQEAKIIQGKTDMTDASAAAIILNSYLSKHHGN